jgi:hypothetical protein
MPVSSSPKMGSSSVPVRLITGRSLLSKIPPRVGSTLRGVAILVCARLLFIALRTYRRAVKRTDEERAQMSFATSSACEASPSRRNNTVTIRA